MRRTTRPTAGALLTIAILAAACAPPGSALPSGAPSRSPSAPSPSASPQALEWRKADRFPATVEGSAVTGVTATATGFVGVGFDGGSRAQVYLSADGRSWTLASHSAAFDDAVMIGVTSRGRRLVAVGRDVTSIEHDVAAAWTSEDGIAWRRSSREDLDGGQMVRVVPGGPGFVAVGNVRGTDAAAVWMSADGMRWQRVAHQASLDRAFMWDVTATPQGLVASGWRRDPEPSAAIWLSRDGREWTLGSVAGGQGFQIRAVSAFGGRFVAAGDLERGHQAAVWTSDDGRAWTRVSAGTFGGASITTLLPIGDQLIALGGRGGSAAVWTSRDGLSWSSIADEPTFGGAHLTAGAWSMGRAVAVGATQVPIEGTGSYISHAMAWQAAPAAR